MATPFHLYDYKCNRLPKTLWRVTHGNTQSLFQNGDIVAVDDTREFRDDADLADAVQNHVNWYSKQPSCFLSVFTDKTHARNWAKQREKGYGPVYVHEISTDLFPACTYVLDIEVLMNELEIVHPYSANELLILHRIPARSIVSTQSPGESPLEHPELGNIPLVLFPPVPGLPTCGFEDCWDHDIVCELSDPVDSYDTDDSVEERNLEDDLVKGMEGLLV